MAKKNAASPPPRTALIVLGMHRSGTSALAGVLAKMGADLPQDLMMPAEQNAKGFFESNRISGLNEALLASAGRTFYSYEPVPTNWFRSPKATEFETRALEALEEDYGQSHLFVVKDPRMCRLLPFWHRVFARAKCRVLHVCTHRHPLEVAESMNRVSSYETDYAVNLWLRHVLEAEHSSRGYPRVFTSYNQLMADSVDVVTRIGSGLALKWPREPRTVAPDLKDFLSKDLRNFHTLDGTPHTHAALSVWAQSALDIMDKWVLDGEIDADYKKLDRLRSEVAKSSDSMGQSLWQNQEKRWKIDALQRRIDELAQHAQRVQDTATSHAANHATEQKLRGTLEVRIVELEQALHSIRGDAEVLRATCATEQRARTAAEAIIADLEKAHQSKVAEVEAEFQRTLEAEKERYRALAENHAALEIKQDATSQALEDITHECNQFRSALEQSRTETEDLHRQTISDAHKISTLEAYLQTLERKYAELERKSKRSAHHLKALTQQLAFRISNSLDKRLGSTPKDPEKIELSFVEDFPHNDRSNAPATLKDTHMEEELNLKLQAAFAEAETWRSTHSSERQARMAAETRIIEHERKLQAALQEVETLRSEIMEAQATQQITHAYNQELLNSTSWRITSPLRYVVRVIRKM